MAHVAEEGLRIDVDEHVILQVSALDTSVMTLLTFESLVLGVNALVLV